MIRVTIELVPKGDENHRRTLATAKISNDVGSYDYDLFSGYRRVRRGHIAKFFHSRYSVWYLLAAILKAEFDSDKSIGY